MSLPLWTWLLACTGSELGQPEPPPAVVLVVVDSLRPDHLGAYGYGRDTSPGLDAWAAQATRFTAAWSPSPATVPAARSLLAADELQAFAPVDHLAHRLGNTGWSTHLLAGNLFLTGAFGFDDGWSISEHRELAPASAQVSRALELLTDRQQPTFLLLHLTDLLLPHTEGPEYQGLFAGEAPTLRVEQPTEELMLRRSLAESPPTNEELAYLAARYDQNIRALDAALAPLLQGLLPQDTLILTAPHGEALGEGGQVGHGTALDEAQLRVPLIINGPAWSSREVSELVDLADVGATVLALADVPLLPLAKGRDLATVGTDGWFSRPLRLGPTLYGPATVGLKDEDRFFTVSLGLATQVQEKPESPSLRSLQFPDWTGAMRAAWKRATGESTRRVLHLQVQPFDVIGEPLSWKGPTEVVVRHPKGFVELWAPPLPIHPAPWGFEATRSEVRISSANQRLPRELLLQLASPAELDGLELEVLLDGERHVARWEDPGRRVEEGETVLTVGPPGRELSAAVTWAPPPVAEPVFVPRMPEADPGAPLSRDPAPLNSLKRLAPPEAPPAP